MRPSSLRVAAMVVGAMTAVAASVGARQSAPMTAFFYQTVSPTIAMVRAGATADGTNIRTYDTDLVVANRGANASALGDPVFSRLADGRWAMTASKRQNATTGTPGLAYYEGACPVVNEAEIRLLSASSATGCDARRIPAMAKTSQVVSLDGSTFVFLMSNGEIYLTRLSSPSQAVSGVTSLCMKTAAIDSIHDLAPGDSARVIAAADAQGLLLSDTAITRRSDGTWVLFVKGIASSTNASCTMGSLCELCARNIYRAVSADLVHWSALEQVMTEASVPEAVRDPDGKVWLYYQNFANACAANNLRLAERAPITGAFELDGGTMSYGFDVRFSNESFETDTSQHYPTNGNPIALPDAAAYDALNACLGKTPR